MINLAANKQLLGTLAIDPAAIKQDLDSLAREISTGDRDAAMRLQRLGEAVVEKPSGPYREAWASSDLHQMIHPELIIERYRDRLLGKNLLLESLEVLRNISIFLPIAITWYSISQATQQYNQFISSQPANIPPQNLPSFLTLWLQGFGGKLPGWLTLSSVAGIDVFIIVGIIIVTIAVHLLANRNRQQQEQKALKLHSRLIHVLAGATLCLKTTKPATLVAPADSLDGVARQIEDMSNRILLTFDNFEKRLSTQFDEITIQLKKDFGGITHQFLQQSSQINEEMRQQLQQGTHYLSQLGATASTVSQLSSVMNTTAGILKDAGIELTSGIEKLVKPATDLSLQQRQLLDAVNQSLTLLQDNARTLNALGMSQQDWGRELVDALDNVKIEVQKSADMATQMTQVAMHQSHFLSQLELDRDAQSKLAERMNSATQGLAGVLATVQVSNDALRQIAVDSNDLLRLYASLPRSIHNDMNTILHGYAGATQMIEKSGRDLSDSAASIITASQYLEKVLNDVENRLARI